MTGGKTKKIRKEVDRQVRRDLNSRAGQRNNIPLAAKERRQPRSSTVANGVRKKAERIVEVKHGAGKHGCTPNMKNVSDSIHTPLKTKDFAVVGSDMAIEFATPNQPVQAGRMPPKGQVRQTRSYIRVTPKAGTTSANDWKACLVGTSFGCPYTGTDQVWVPGTSYNGTISTGANVLAASDFSTTDLPPLPNFSYEGAVWCTGLRITAIAQESPISEQAGRVVFGQTYAGPIDGSTINTLMDRHYSQQAQFEAVVEDQTLYVTPSPYGQRFGGGDINPHAVSQEVVGGWWYFVFEDVPQADIVFRIEADYTYAGREFAPTVSVTIDPFAFYCATMCAQRAGSITSESAPGRVDQVARGKAMENEKKAGKSTLGSMSSWLLNTALSVGKEHGAEILSSLLL